MKIQVATMDEREWAAGLMAVSEPWLTLGITGETCLEIVADPALVIYIAHAHEQPAGFIILHPHGLAGSPYVKSICVASNARSRGIGAALIEFAEHLFRPESNNIFLCVSSFNRRAQLFYGRLGYHKVGEFKDYILAGESEILLHKRLK